MKNSNLMNSVTRTFNRAGLQLKKHSPEILITVGIVGTVVSTVMACKATTKVSTIIDEAKNNVDIIHDCVQNPEMEDKYTVEDSKKDLAIVYAQTGVKLAILYGRL